MKRDILYVDDELDNLVVFQATFEDSFNVVTATSGQEALEILQDHTFPVVLADQRMPGMTGAELFEQMHRRYPYTKRVMLTGYADSQAMLDAINQGQVYYFIKKPWEQEVVQSVLLRAIEAYDLTVANLALTDRLVAADRCAALGRSAARIAHEMGNLLCMLPLLELIEEEYADHSDLVEMATAARNTYERLCQLVGEVKDFVRLERDGLPMQVLSMVDVVHELAAFLRYDNALPLNRLAVDIRAEPTVRSHKVKLQQVLINLLKNAAHAIRDRRDGRMELQIDADAQHCILRVADNGCGMTPEVARRIWEPFFTTKGEEGTGLGLDIVQSIIQAHRGHIECQSAPNRGTTFTIRLPRVDAEAAPRVPPEAPQAALPPPGVHWPAAHSALNHA